MTHIQHKKQQLSTAKSNEGSLRKLKGLQFLKVTPSTKNEESKGLENLQDQAKPFRRYHAKNAQSVQILQTKFDDFSVPQSIVNQAVSPSTRILPLSSRNSMTPFSQAVGIGNQVKVHTRLPSQGQISNINKMGQTFSGNSSIAGFPSILMTDRKLRKNQGGQGNFFSNAYSVKNFLFNQTQGRFNMGHNLQSLLKNSKSEIVMNTNNGNNYGNQREADESPVMSKNNKNDLACGINNNHLSINANNNSRQGSKMLIQRDKLEKYINLEKLNKNNKTKDVSYLYDSFRQRMKKAQNLHQLQLEDEVYMESFPENQPRIIDFNENIMEEPYNILMDIFKVFDDEQTHPHFFESIREENFENSDIQKLHGKDQENNVNMMGESQVMQQEDIIKIITKMEQHSPKALDNKAKTLLDLKQHLPTKKKDAIQLKQMFDKEMKLLKENFEKPNVNQEEIINMFQLLIDYTFSQVLHQFRIFCKTRASLLVQLWQSLQYLIQIKLRVSYSKVIAERADLRKELLEVNQQYAENVKLFTKSFQENVDMKFQIQDYKDRQTFLKKEVVRLKNKVNGILVKHRAAKKIIKTYKKKENKGWTNLEDTYISEEVLSNKADIIVYVPQKQKKVKMEDQETQADFYMIKAEWQRNQYVQTKPEKNKMTSINVNTGKGFLSVHNSPQRQIQSQKRLSSFSPSALNRLKLKNKQQPISDESLGQNIKINEKTGIKEIRIRGNTPIYEEIKMSKLQGRISLNKPYLQISEPNIYPSQVSFNFSEQEGSQAFHDQGVIDYEVDHEEEEIIYKSVSNDDDDSSDSQEDESEFSSEKMRTYSKFSKSQELQAPDGTYQVNIKFEKSDEDQESKSSSQSEGLDQMDLINLEKFNSHRIVINEANEDAEDDEFELKMTKSASKRSQRRLKSMALSNRSRGSNVSNNSKNSMSKRKIQAQQETQKKARLTDIRQQFQDKFKLQDQLKQYRTSIRSQSQILGNNQQNTLDQLINVLSQRLDSYQSQSSEDIQNQDQIKKLMNGVLVESKESLLGLLNEMQLTKVNEVEKKNKELEDKVRELQSAIDLMKQNQKNQEQQEQIFKAKRQALNVPMRPSMMKQLTSTSIKEYLQIKDDKNENDDKLLSPSSNFDKDEHRLRKRLKSSARIQFNLSQNIELHQSEILIRKYQSSQKFQKSCLKEAFSLKQVCKHISMAYSQCKSMQKKTLATDKDKDKDEEKMEFIKISESLYEMLVQKHGFPTFAQKKYKQMLGGLAKNHMACSRIKMFNKFMGISLDNYNYDVVDFDFYIRGQEFMDNHTAIGITYNFLETDEIFWVPYLRLLEFIKITLEDNLRAEESSQMKKDIEKLKEKCIKHINIKGKINFDLAMEQLIYWNRIVIQRAKDHVKELFNAIDFDSSGYIEAFEFISISRCIEGYTLPFDRAYELFSEFSGNYEFQGQKIRGLTLEKFTNICVLNNIFSLEKQNRFIGVDQHKDINQIFKTLKKLDVNANMNIVMMRLKDSEMSQDYINMWENIINGYKQQLEKATQHQARSMCLIYKFIEKISVEYYLEKLTDKILGKELCSMNNLTKSPLEIEFDDI